MTRTIERFYAKLRQGKSADDIRIYRSDIYYIRALVKYNFGIEYTPEQIYNMLHEEGLMEWRDYVPPGQTRRWKKYIALINSTDITDT